MVVPYKSFGRLGHFFQEREGGDAIYFVVAVAVFCFKLCCWVELKDRWHKGFGNHEPVEGSPRPDVFKGHQVVCFHKEARFQFPPQYLSEHRRVGSVAKCFKIGKVGRTVESKICSSVWDFFVRCICCCCGCGCIRRAILLSGSHGDDCCCC